jgi:phosphatidylserine/phosphatidylglycerophosphate/cardiolipin synthase-like enzyme
MRFKMRSYIVAATAAMGSLALNACDASQDSDEPELGVAQSAVSVASTTIAGFPAWAHFTNPPAFAGDDRTILNEAIRLINDTPSGARIRAAIHSLSVNGVQTALVNAKNRGVTVQVVEDGSDEFDPDASPHDLHAALGASHVFCGGRVQGGNYGCITSDPSGIMHTKLYTFSQTKDPNGVLRSNVVWFGSANMTYATGAQTFNNTITIYGDVDLFNNFNTYFTQLFNQNHYAGNNFYDATAGRGYWVTSTARVYASPDQDSDLVYNRLNDIGADSTCRVRVAQAMIHDSRLELVDLLVRLKQGGCGVWVVGSSIEPIALSRLKGAGIGVRKHDVHDKFILVNAKFAGSADNRSLVFTGSHNWTYSANYRNDELFVRVESQDFYTPFYNHFNDAYNTGTAL